MMNSNGGINVPRYFYRDVQQVIAEIAADASRLGSVRTAMIQRIANHADKLPESRTVDQIVDQICETADLFCQAEAKITADDIRAKLQQIVSQFTEEEAFCYLSMLEVTFTAFNASADKRMVMMSTEEVQREIENSLANPGELSMAERIDALVDDISGDALKTFVFAGGSEQLAEAANTVRTDSAAGAQMMVDVLNSGFEKNENYAMAACACYEQVINGRIEGMTAENADPRMVTALVSAGLSKGTILKRLMRGEIDMEMAQTLLGYVENAIKWVLTVIYQALVGVVVLSGLTVIIIALEWAIEVSAALFCMAILLAVGAGLNAGREGREMSKAAMDVAKFVLSLPIKAGRFLVKTVKTAAEKQRARQAQSSAKPVKA